MFILIPPLWPAIPVLLTLAGTLLVTFPATYATNGLGTINTMVGVAALVAVAF